MPVASFDLLIWIGNDLIRLADKESSIRRWLLTEFMTLCREGSEQSIFGDGLLLLVETSFMEVAKVFGPQIF